MNHYSLLYMHKGPVFIILVYLYMPASHMGVNPINKLSYGLLGLLSTQPMTGYDLTLKINRFWRSTHSAIYPLLSELEEEGYIEFLFEKQNGKPDKKIYSLTDKGKKLLHDWFMSEAGDAVVRDEMILKLFCTKSVDTEAAMKVLDEYEARYRKKITEYTSYIEKIKLRSCEHSENDISAIFGSYILTQRSLNEALLNLKWCEWVRTLYETEGYGFLKEDYDYRRTSN